MPTYQHLPPQPAPQEHHGPAQHAHPGGQRQKAPEGAVLIGDPAEDRNACDDQHDGGGPVLAARGEHRGDVGGDGPEAGGDEGEVHFARPCSSGGRDTGRPVARFQK